MKKRFEKLLEKAAWTEDFQVAYTLGGFDLTVNILDLKEDLEEIVGAGLADTPDDLPPDEYMDALEYALEGEAQDILGIDPLYSFRGTMAERAKELKLTYGEFFAYNLLAQSWIEFIVDISGNKGHGDEYYDEAEHYLIEVFFQKLEEKRKNPERAERWEAQMVFNNLYEKLPEGDPQTLIDMVRTGLVAGGFNFDSRESIDRIEKEIIEPIYNSQRAEEERLTQEAKDILIEAGATELQLTWGNLSQARPNIWQRRKLREIDEKLNEARTGGLVSMVFAAVLNEAKEKLG